MNACLNGMASSCMHVSPGPDKRDHCSESQTRSAVPREQDVATCASWFVWGGRTPVRDGHADADVGAAAALDGARRRRRTMSWCWARA
jgi:hypothetical protein